MPRTGGAGTTPGNNPEAGRLHWWGTLLYVPVLYGGGWLLSRPLLLLRPAWRIDQVDLAGVAVALVRGLIKAVLLLALVVVPLLLTGAAHWQGSLSPALAANALTLGAGVGFAEELLFRGWLLGELEPQIGARRALGLQAALFALVHPWYRLGGLDAVALLGGLVLLGIALALQRRADHGVLWGAIGLHGGLVGGWLALQAGLLQLSPCAPVWLIGPGGAGANPIGGLLGWLGLGALLLVRRRWW